MTIRITLDETIKASDGKLTRNAIAVHARVRPATLHDMANGKTKSISYDTLDKIITAMNELNPGNNYDISAVMVYEKTGDQ